MTWTEVPGLAAGERAVVRKAPFVSSNLPIVGGGQPEQIFNGSGLWFAGNCPCGDFSGTGQRISDVGVEPEVFGSGGPAVLPWGPTGTDTVLSAGKLRANGASDTVFPVEVDLGTPTAGWTYKVALRRLTEQIIGDAGVGSSVVIAATWDASLNTFTAAGKFGSFIETGDDWVYISKAENRTAVGTFTHSAANDLLTLVAHGLEAGEKVVLSFPGAAPGTNLAEDVHYYVANASANTIQLARTRGGWPINLNTPNNSVDVLRVTAANTGWYRVEARRGNDSLLLNALQGEIFSTIDLNTCELIVLQSAQAISMPLVTWDEATKKFSDASLNGYLTGYTPGPDDTVLVRRGYVDADGSGFLETYTKVVSCPDVDSIVVADGGLGGANNKCDIVVFKRTAFEHRTVDSWTTTDVTVTSAFSWTPQWGDFYYIYIDDGADWTPGPSSSPEACPTPTEISSLACFHPYTTPTRHEKSSLADHQGHAIIPSAASGTQMNLYWWGTFITHAEAFNAGDELHLIWAPADYQYNGTPFFLEVLIWPNMDPGVDWAKDGSVDNNARLATKVVRFQSGAITAPGIHPMRVELVGKAGGRQTEGADNYSFGWTCRFEIGETSSHGYDAPITGFPQQRGPVSIVTDQNDFDPTIKDVRWQVLIKAEHISLLGKPGYHGYYAGEPFSCTTGNGGTLLHNVGPTSGINTLPFGPRIRYSSFAARRWPAASY